MMMSWIQIDAHANEIFIPLVVIDAVRQIEKGKLFGDFNPPRGLLQHRRRPDTDIQRSCLVIFILKTSYLSRNVGTHFLT
jgi:hypothetical protein